MAPKVSVIIPLYNKEAHIARALNSVITQTFDDFEIIIIDDKSNDDGPAVVRNFQDPRIIFVEQDHWGVSFTRNHGIALSKSDFIAFLDADDEWMPRHLETLLRLRTKFPDAGIYTTAYQWLSKTRNATFQPYRVIPKPPFEGLLPNYFEAGALGRPPVVTSVAGISKKILLEAGMFEVGISMGEDLDLFARIALNYPVAFCSEIGAVIHEDASNRTCDTYYPWLEEEILVKNGKKAISDGKISREMLPHFQKYIERKELDTVKYHIIFGNYPLAKKLLAQTKTHYFWLEKIKWNVITRIPGPVIILIKYFKAKVRESS